MPLSSYAFIRSLSSRQNEFSGQSASCIGVTQRRRESSRKSITSPRTPPRFRRRRRRNASIVVLRATFVRSSLGVFERESFAFPSSSSSARRGGCPAAAAAAAATAAMETRRDEESEIGCGRSTRDRGSLVAPPPPPLYSVGQTITLVDQVSQSYCCSVRHCAELGRPSRHSVRVN